MISLDLSSFYISSAKDISYMFHNCIKLEYLNIMTFHSNIGNYTNMFLGTSEYLIYCIRSNIKDTDQIKSQLMSKKCSLLDCSSNWQTKKKKLITYLDICIDNCSTISLYEYNNECYSKCPNGTKSSDNNKYICQNISNEIIINELSYYDFYEKTEIKDNIYQSKLINDLRNIFNNNTFLQNYLYQKYIDYIIQDIKKGNFDYILLNNKENSEEINDYIIKEKDIVFQVTSSYNQKNKIYDNLSTIILEEECENLLKEKYNINKNDSLLIFKYEYFVPGLKIPLIGYEIFHPITKEQLQLELCKKKKCSINYSCFYK